MSEGNLPAEILYHIVANVVAEYVDFAITAPPDKLPDNGKDPQNPIIPLFAVNHAFRASVRKVLSDAFGIPQDDEGRLTGKLKPWHRISGIRKLWRYAHLSKLQEYTKLSLLILKLCGPSPAPLVRSYTMLSAVGLLIAENVIPTIHNVQELEGNCFDNPALEAYQHALDVQPRILAQYLLPRIQRYLWTFYIGDKIVTELERLSDAQSELSSHHKGTASYENAYVDLLDAMTKLRDVMEQDNDLHVKEWGPFLGPSSLLPEFMGDVRRLATPLFMLPTTLLSDNEDHEKKEKLMLELYNKWEPFATNIFPVGSAK